ncbi:MAG: ECF transporter S component [Candidatus Micrarchaeota archaeon]
MQRQAAVFGLLATAVSSGVLLKALGAPPNIELLMPFILGAGLVFGPLQGLFVGCLARAAYDVYMGFVGPWTLYTAPAYGVVGLFAGFFGMYRKSYSRVQMTFIAALLTLVYDVITMVVFGMQFGVPLQAAAVSQVPFTALHLAGNCTFVFLICPRLVGFVRSASNAQARALVAASGSREDG